MNTHSNTTDEQTITLYKYIKAEYLPEFLNTGYLKVAKIGEVNDPFESIPCFDPKDSLDRLINEITNSVNSDISYKETEIALKDFEEAWELMRSRSSVRYISFSTLCSSILMWGHYADNHKGACLAFQFKLNELNDLFPNTQLTTMLYSRERVSLIPYILSQGLNINTKEVPQLFRYLCGFTKAKDWEYEKEARLYINPKIHLRERKGIRSYGDTRRALSGIILGINFEQNSEAVKELVISGLHNNHIAYTRARQSLKEYRVENDTFFDLPDGDYEKLSEHFGLSFLQPDYQKVFEAGKSILQERYSRLRQYQCTQ